MKVAIRSIAIDVVAANRIIINTGIYSLIA
jgi:hypothetical protein